MQLGVYVLNSEAAMPKSRSGSTYPSLALRIVNSNETFNLHNLYVSIKTIESIKRKPLATIRHSLSRDS
jgi:hypothetical protein